ncbi:hypothetical protein GCM10009804_32180 [Kribbella hippodromi]|uniref:DksA C4-type domain-containing protein n=1 Tax=Kribbella hippodromi TaxID=434347 RepID=A0ABP4P533_9ACTN
MNSQTRKSRNGGIPKIELAGLRAILLDQRTFRREQLAQIRQRPKPTPTTSHPSTPNAGASRAGRVEGAGAGRAEVEDCLVVAARDVLADVEAALDRMDTGHYGECRECRGGIALSRLRICPQTLYCGECHRARETADR